MKQGFINSLNSISHLFSTKQLIKFTGQKLLLPTYHLVTDHKNDHTKHLYPARSIELFEKDIEFFLKYYDPITLADIYNLKLGEKKFTKNYFHLSFDDGLREVYDFVFPILRKKGLQASVFLNTAFIDNQDLFYRFKASIVIEKIISQKLETIEFLGISYDKNQLIKKVKNIDFSQQLFLDELGSYLEIDFHTYLDENKPYLSTSQISELIDAGFEIGAHSINHPDFRKLGFEDQVVQVSESVGFVKEKFKQKLNTFAFPFTDDGLSKALFDHIFKNKIVDLSFGGAGLKDDFNKFHLQRIPMERNLNSAKTTINTEYLYYMVKAFFNKNIITRK